MQRMSSSVNTGNKEDEQVNLINQHSIHSPREPRIQPDLALHHNENNGINGQDCPLSFFV